MAVGPSCFLYEMHYDHDILDGLFKNIVVYDFTSYPKTINPRESSKASLNNYNIAKQEIIGTLKGEIEL